MEEMREKKELAGFATYGEYKEAFDREVSRVELGFVRIGYMLRIAKDTDILRDSGYANMEEFAEAEYRIDKSQASRFININMRFSEGGYSDRLQERFEGYGVAKLGELLALPDEIIEVLPQELPRSGIQEIKKEIREEQKISDLEVLMEEPAEAEGEKSLLERWLGIYLQAHPEKRAQVGKLKQSGEPVQAAMDILAPGGSAAETARIPGVGKLLLAVKGKEQPVVLMNVRNNEREEYSWEDCMAAMERAAESLPETEKAEVAPVQPEAARKEPENAREETKNAQEAERRETEEEKDVPEEPQKADTEESRQMEIEEYPGITPENCIVCHDGTQVVSASENIRDEGVKLAEEVAQLMRTGTMEHAGQTERNLLRLQEILQQIRNGQNGG